MELDVIYNEDCLEGMKGLPDASVDLVCTDPPYSLGFMGLKWDEALPSVQIWKQCLRVLKPGAFAFIMCIPRQDCLARMTVNLEDAGFNVSFSSLYWCYATGFPKAGNVSKLVDRRLGMEREIIGRKPGLHSRGTMKTLPEGWHRPWMDDEKQRDVAEMETIAASPEAKALEGAYCGFQPKPALEICLVAMRPLSERSYIDQAMANGKGCTWLDDGRIPFLDSADKDGKYSGTHYGGIQGQSGIFNQIVEGAHSNLPAKGRFPANVLVSDDLLNEGSNHKTGNRKAKGTPIYTFYSRHHSSTCRSTDSNTGSEGSYSRFFSLDSWWAERIKQLPESVQKTFPFLIVPKAGKKEKNKGLEGFDERIVECLEGNKDGTLNKRTNHRPSMSRNYHPCVKPLKLISYLITIGSREGDVILDPFLGSGTTAVACKMLNRRFIGYEIDADYCEIARRRIAAVDAQPDFFSEARVADVDTVEQLDLFAWAAD